MAYDLWETRSGTIIDTFPTEAAALAEVRATIAEFGRESIATFALARETRRGTELIAQGDALAKRALDAAEPAQPTPRPSAIPA